MPNPRYQPEQVVNLLRKMEVEIATARRRRKRPEKWGSRNRRTTAGGRNSEG